jgi:hypothetical protein
MEDRETPRLRKYGESKTIQIMMATVPHFTAWVGRTKYADGFLFDRVYLEFWCGLVLYPQVGNAINAFQSSRHNQFAERKQWMVVWVGVNTVRDHVNEQSNSFIGVRPVRQVLPIQLTKCESPCQSPNKWLNTESSLQTFILLIIK